MPWKESRIVDQRLQFLSSYQKEEMSLSDLCREFGVSRPTGYRWINRYKEVGPEGLLDLSRKPHGCSHATSEATENAILALRNKHPSWGARKLKARLEKIQPSVDWPAASTFGNILSRAGLVARRREGQEVRYALTPEPLGQAAEWLSEIGARWDARLARLQAYLAPGGSLSTELEKSPATETDG